MLQAFTKRFCLLTVVMLLSVVNALAQTETAYGGGALPDAPTKVGDVWNVTAKNAQYVLDGAYGSIDGKTINFTESISETLEFGRPTKYTGSNSKYYRHAFGSQERTLEFMNENKGKVVDGDGSVYYTRSISNVTFTAEEGVTLNGFHTVAGGHVTGPNVYDYVIDYLHENEGSVYYYATAINGVTFDGITFIGRVNNQIDPYDIAEMNDFTFENCTFNIGYTTDNNQGIRHYNNNNAKYIATGLVVKNCMFNTVYQGVYTQNVKNVTVDGCTFNTTGHNAIGVQDGTLSYNHGAVVITNNTGTNIGDRAIRLNNVGSDTQFTITGNNFTLAEGKSEEWIKANSLAEGITYNVADNTWTNFLDAYNEEFRTQTAYVAQIGDEKYETLQAAIAAVPADGTKTTITMLADESIEGNAGLTIAKNQNIVLDLNGKTIQNLVNENKGSQVFQNNGTLSIKDSAGNGVIKNNVKEGTQAGEWWSTPQRNYTTNVITNTGTLNILSGTIQQTASGSICYAVDNNSNGVDAILNVEGGKLTSVKTVVRQFCNSTTKQNVLNISGGKVETEGYAAIWTQLPGSSSDSKKLATINITGGEITGGSYAWYDYSFGDSFEAVSYSISGGTFTGELYSYAVKKYGVKEGFITGGTFSVDPSDYVAAGYEAVENSDGTYTVQKAIGPVMITGGVEEGAYYATLEEAFAAVKDGQEIFLRENIKLSDALNLELAGKTVIFNLGGNTLDGRVNLKSGTLTVQNGTVTVMDGTEIKPDGQALNVYGSPTAAQGYSVLNVKCAVKAGFGVCMFGATGTTNGYGAVVNILSGANLDCTGEAAIFVSGNLGKNIADDMNNVINIESDVYGSNSVGVALNGNATVNVKEGAMITGNTAIAIKRGVLNVIGGTVWGEGAENLDPDANNNGVELTGAGISMTNTYNDYGPMAVNISGGDIISDHSKALFKKEDNYANAATFAVSGGIFKTPVLAEFCAAGYEPAPSDDAICPYTVKAIDYTIVNYNENGNTVTASKNTAIVGDEITLTITTAAGYSLKSLSLNGGAQLEAVQSNKEQRTFVMPAANVTISAEFVQNATESVETIEEATIKTDGEEHSTATITNVEIAQEGVKNVTVSAAIGSADVTEIAEGAFASLPESVQTIDLSSTKVELSGDRSENEVLSDIPANVLVYLPSSSSVTGTNVVIKKENAEEYTCKSLLMEDMNDYSVPTAFTAETATLDRSFTANVASTLCLPYDVPASNINTKGKIYRFASIDLKACTITMTEETGGLKANVPYIFMPNAGTTSISASDIEVKMENPQTTQGTFAFVGVFEKKVFTKTECDNGIYGYTGKAQGNYSVGQFAKGGEGAYIVGMRAYLMYTGGDVSAAPGLNGAAAATSLPSRFNVQLQDANGETTEILNLDMETAEDGTPVYNLSGQRVNNPEKGIYIKNGKKVIIK